MIEKMKSGERKITHHLILPKHCEFLGIIHPKQQRIPSLYKLQMYFF